MADLTNLSRDVTPTEFFTEILPEVLGDVVGDERFQNEILPTLGTERLQFHVTGNDGIDIHLGVDADKELTLEEGDAEAPPIAVTVSVSDFRSIIAGDLRDKVKAVTGSVMIGPRQLRKAFLPDAKVQRVKALRGDLQMRIVDKEDAATYVVTTTLGGASPNVDKPACTVTLDVPTLLDVVTGKQQAQQLFFQGKIRVDGDMGVMLGLMSALTAP